MDRVTLKTIADRAGVTVSCVSQALRDLPGVGAATKERIQRLARELGYRPDPALSALVAYRARTQPAAFRSVLAWVGEHHEVNAPKSPRFVASRGRAASLGYHMEFLPLASPKHDWAKVLRIARARGIRGIFLAPRSRYDEEFPDVSLTDCCLTTVGYSVRLPGIHRVSTNQYLDMFRHVEALREWGYRKIGLWVPPQADGRVNHQFSGGYLAAHFAAGDIPPEINTRENLRKAELSAWIRSQELDCVIGLSGHLAPLRDAGFRIPDDLGFSTFDWHGGEEVRDVSGMDYCPDRLLEGAVDVLHSLLLNNRTGLSEAYPLTLYHGRMVEGRTTRRCPV